MTSHMMFFCCVSAQGYLHIPAALIELLDLKDRPLYKRSELQKMSTRMPDIRIFFETESIPKGGSSPLSGRLKRDQGMNFTNKFINLSRVGNILFDV